MRCEPFVTFSSALRRLVRHSSEHPEVEAQHDGKEGGVQRGAAVVETCEELVVKQTHKSVRGHTAREAEAEMTADVPLRGFIRGRNKGNAVRAAGRRGAHRSQPQVKFRLPGDGRAEDRVGAQQQWAIIRTVHGRGPAKERCVEAKNRSHHGGGVDPGPGATDARARGPASAGRKVEALCGSGKGECQGQTEYNGQDAESAWTHVVHLLPNV